MKNWKIEILNLMLVHLWNGCGDKPYYEQCKQKFMCGALNAAAKDVLAESKNIKKGEDSPEFLEIICAQKEIKRVIMAGIDNNFTADIYVKRLGMNLSAPEMQEWRKNFINKMIYVIGGNNEL